MAGELSSAYHGEVRPWGSYLILHDGLDCKVKRIVVKPGQKLSLQYHHHRDELWHVVAGKGKVRRGEVDVVLTPQQTIQIFRKMEHRVENIGEEDLVFIEIQTGEYFGEDDIVRIEDDYGRV